MTTIWDFCRTCGKQFPNGELGQKEFRDCKRCKVINFGVLLLTILSIISILGLGILCRSKNWVGLVGLILDIIGAYLLATGYLEAMVQAACGLDSVDVIRGLKEKHSFRIWLGLVSLILGFLFQAINLM